YSVQKMEKAEKQQLQERVTNGQTHTHSLSKKLACGLRNSSFKIIGGNDLNNLSTILCFDADETVHDWLEKQGISVTHRKGAIRVSPHFYNSPEDIDHLLNTLEAYENSITKS